VVLRGHRTEVNSIRFTPDGTHAVTAGDDGTVRLWDLADGRPTWRAPMVLADLPLILTHRGWHHPLDADSSPGTTAWMQRVADVALVADRSPDGQLICSATIGGELELLDAADGAIAATRPLADIRRLIALDTGCAVLTADGTAQLVSRDGRARTLHIDATSLDRAQDGIAVASGDWIYKHDAAGEVLMRYPGDRGVSATAMWSDLLVVGHAEGPIDLVDTSGQRPARSLDMDELPLSRIERLLPGPGGTVVAGRVDGGIGVWSTETGARLIDTRLHGPVMHLMIVDSTLVAVSELGDQLSLDLELFERPRCELLAAIWNDVGVAWVDGGPSLVVPPADHECAP
jgi:WD40 repeat protein